MKLIKILPILLLSVFLSLGGMAGGDIPWPLGAELRPFPWDTVNETMWELEDVETGKKMFFRLEVIKTSGASRQLRIEEIDGETDEVLAVGLGIEEDFLVRAVMRRSNSQIYRLVMRHYQSSADEGMGLTVLPFFYHDCDDDCGDDGDHYLLRQVRDYGQSCSWWNIVCRWW